MWKEYQSLVFFTNTGVMCKYRKICKLFNLLWSFSSFWVICTHETICSRWVGKFYWVTTKCEESQKRKSENWKNYLNTIFSIPSSILFHLLRVSHFRKNELNSISLEYEREGKIDKYLISYSKNIFIYSLIFYVCIILQKRIYSPPQT